MLAFADGRIENMYTYQSLEHVSDQIITECFNLAFSDYELPMHLTEEILRLIFTKSCVDKKYSFGAFCQDELVGFIFNSCSVQNGEKVVFDAGTGVVPTHRGKRVFSDLFEYAWEKLKKAGYQRYYLEVLQENTKAISAYQKKGFQETREFSVLRSPTDLLNLSSEKVERASFSDFLKLDITKCYCPKPCYEHSMEILTANPQLYQAMYLEQDDKVSAFCVFTPNNGNLVHVGYRGKEDLKTVLEHLMSNFAGFTVKNIDRKEAELLSLLADLGFEELTRQFEMEKEF